jgi:hypothetical protein
MIDKTLFINLKTIQDVYLTSRLAIQWGIENPDNQVHLLTWKDHEEILDFLPSNITTHFINRDKVKKIKTTEIIPDFHAVNELWGNLEDIFDQKWANAFNMSNDTLSATLSSILKMTNFKGVRFSPDKQIVYSCQWAKYLNEVYPFNPTAINKWEILKELIGLKQDLACDPLFPQSFQEAQDTIDGLKKQKGDNKKIVGIDVSSFIDGEWNIEQIGMGLLNSARFIPIFIHRVDDEKEIPLLEKIQSKLGNDILILETQNNAIEAVVNAMDSVIARDGVLLQIAYYTKTPTLQIRIKDFKNESTGYSYNERDLFIETESSELIAEEVLACLDILNFGRPQGTSQWLFNDIHQIKKDAIGAFKLHINPTDLCLKNITNYQSRIFFMRELSDISIEIKSSPIFSLFTKEEVLNYQDFESKSLKVATIKLLNALRHLKEIKSSPNKSQELLRSLTPFFQNSSSMLSDGIALYFRSEFEYFSRDRSTHILTIIEEILFKLKGKYKKMKEQVFEDELFKEKNV